MLEGFVQIPEHKVEKMKKKLLTITSLACALAVATNAQSYKKPDFGIRASIDSVTIEIQFFGPSTVRVLKLPEDKTFAKNSLSVIGSPQKITLSIREAGSELFLNSDSVRAGLNLINGRISFSTRGGEPLLRESPKTVVSVRGPLQSTIRE